MFSKIAVIALVVVLGLMNWSIAGKEKHLAEGKVVYLELAPVDPRSLMQGDYMALDYQVARAVYKVLPKITEEYRRWRHNIAASDGYAVVVLDENKVASFKRISDEQGSGENEMLLKYRVRNGAVKFATNAFFFQEGHAKYYTSARYGQFRVDDKGELLLVGMYDKELKEIEAKK